MISMTPYMTMMTIMTIIWLTREKCQKDKDGRALRADTFG
jgi:hypothetical protein